MDSIFQDLRYAIRGLARSPGFASAAVLTLAIGIGANTAIYSLARALILRPVAIPDPERVVLIGWQIFSYQDFRDAPQQTPAFSGVAISQSERLSLTANGAEPAEVVGLFVSPTYFAVLNVGASAGRVLQPHDARAPGESSVIVMSHSRAARQFGSADQAVGRKLRLGSQTVEVVGVTPQDFRGTSLALSPDLFIPVTMYDLFRPMFASRPTLENRTRRIFDVLARLQPGVTVEQARAQVTELTGPAWGSLDVSDYVRRRTGVEPINEEALPDRLTVLSALNLLATMVGIILLVGCANVTSLLLSRMDRRQTEFGIRLALGGSAVRLGRLLAAETALLSLLGGLFAIALTLWSVDTLNSLKLDTFLPAGGIEPDRTTLLACGIVSLLTAALCVVIPWASALRADPLTLLKASSGGSGGRNRRRARSALVIGQVAAALVLLVGTAVLSRSLMNQLAVNPGFDSDRIFIVRPNLNHQSVDAAERVQEQFVDRVRQLPNVASVSLAWSVPLDSHRSIGFVSIPNQAPVQIDLNYVDPDYFQAMGIPLVRGRSFTQASTPDEVVVSETFVKRLANEAEPLGRILTTNQGPVRIVGVVRDIKSRDLRSEQPPFLYRRYGIRGAPHIWSGLRTPAGGAIHIRTRKNSAGMISDVRSILREIDPQSSLTSAIPLSEHVDRWLAQSRSLAAVVGVFGFVALVLAAVGLHGLSLQMVSSQLKELGIRLAMGASPGTLRQTVLARSISLTAIGVLLGGILIVALGQKLIGSLVFGVAPADPLTLTVASAALFVMTVLASYLPARRAARVDPATILRAE